MARRIWHTVASKVGAGVLISSVRRRIDSQERAVSTDKLIVTRAAQGRGGHLIQAECCMYGHNNYNLRQMRDETVLKIGQERFCLVHHCSNSKQQHPAQDQCDCDGRPSKAGDVIKCVVVTAKASAKWVHLKTGLHCALRIKAWVSLICPDLVLFRW